MGLAPHRQTVPAQGWTASDVHGCVGWLSLHVGQREVDAGPREKNVGFDRNIGGGKTEAATDAVAGYDRTDQERGPSEKGMRFFDATCLEKCTNSCAADGFPVHDTVGHEAHSEAMRLPQPTQIGGGSQTGRTEAEALTDDHPGRAKVANEDVFRELRRREMCDVAERCCDHAVHISFEELDLDGGGEEQRWASGAIRRRGKGVRDRFQTASTSFISGNSEHGLVAEMNTIERTDSDNRVFHGTSRTVMVSACLGGSIRMS